MSLKATGLRVRLGQREVLRGIDLSVRTGETVAIVGPNGSGKSTLVRTLAGLQKPESGAVAIGDHPVARMRPNQRASALGLLTQSAQIPGLTLVREHVGPCEIVRDQRDSPPPNINLPPCPIFWVFLG